MAVITALFGLVFAIGILVLLKLQIPGALMLPISAAFALTIVLFQYLLGPVLIDAVVQIRWTSPMELGPEFDRWLHTTCATFKIPTPRFGIIEEGSPNAFTYGNGPWNARVVVTRGVIDALDPEELKAVVAHELGHIKHRDFIVMTIVQALVLALYTLYITSRYTGRRNGAYVAVLSFVAYQLSYYISLFLSRLREYMADYASGQIMMSGNTLSSALVKISYGMGRFQPASPGAMGRPYYTKGSPMPGMAAVPYTGLQAAAPPRMPPVMNTPMSSDRVTPDLMAKLHGIQMESDKRNNAAAQGLVDPKSHARISAQALGAFGIASAASMRAAVAWQGVGGTIDPTHFTAGARWELYNPWAKIAELVSTHPLTARRIQALQKLNTRWKVAPQFDFSKVQPGRYTGFFGDLIVVALPFLLALAAAGASWVAFPVRGDWSALSAMLFGLAGYCAGCFVQLLFKYRGTFLRSNIMRCLSELNVSHVRPIPVAIQGVFTGRLSAGMPWADDYVLQDSSGFVACMLHQPLKFLEFLWGWMYSQRFVGQDVIVYGWYRRFGSPMIEISHFQVVSTKETIRSYYYPVTIVFSFLVGIAAFAGAMLLAR
jgi:Zn-dependent protease with chaperone function